MDPDQLPDDDPFEPDTDFDAGFGDATRPTATPGEGAQAAATVEEPEAGTEGQAQAEPEERQLRQLTQKEYDALMARVAEIDAGRTTSQQSLDKAFGKLGGIERQLQQLARSGVSEVSKDDFTELHAEFPELAELTLKGFNRALAKAAGGGAPAIDDARIQAVVAPVLQRFEQVNEMRNLTRAHPDWEAVTASPDWATWAAAQPDAVREQLTGWDSDFIASQIAAFKATRKPAAKPAADARRARLQQAITPRGTGGHAPAPSDDDDFDAGFKSG